MFDKASNVLLPWRSVSKFIVSVSMIGQLVYFSSWLSEVLNSIRTEGQIFPKRMSNDDSKVPTLYGPKRQAHFTHVMTVASVQVKRNHLVFTNRVAEPDSDD